MTIDTLTPEQEAAVLTHHADWLSVGTSTERADRASAERAITAMYARIGERPPGFLWCDSPATSILGLEVLRRLAADLKAESLESSLRSSLWSSLRSSLWSSLRSSLWSSLESSLGSSLESSLESSLWSSLWSSLESSLRSSLWSSLESSLGSSLGSSLWSSLESSLGSSLGSSLESSLWSSLESSLWSSLESSLRSSLWSSLRSSLWSSLESSLRSCWWGQHDSSWIAFYLYPELYLGVAYDQQKSADLRLWEEVARSACWWWPYKDLVVVSERPTECHMEVTGVRAMERQLHRENGPALAFADGWEVHAWHGFSVPAWVTGADGGVTPERIANEPNVETRRCAIEAFGWDRFIASAELVPVATAADPGNAGNELALYDVPERLWGDRVRLLLCTNGSTERDGTRRRYGLTVPADIATPVAAAAWTYDLTPDQYAGLARRT